MSGLAFVLFLFIVLGILAIVKLALIYYPIRKKRDEEPCAISGHLPFIYGKCPRCGMEND